jgi:hypothetical protein
LTILITRDTAILESVWRALEDVAAEFPDDEGVVMTLQYHGWYSAQCVIVLRKPESPTPPDV